MWIISIFALSLAVAGLFRRYVKPDAGDILVATIAFLPGLVLLVQDPSIAEISGYGVQLRKFQRELQQSISAAGLPIGEIDANWVTPVDPEAPSFEVAAQWEACVEIFWIRPSAVPDRNNEAQFESYLFNAVEAIRASLVCGKLVGLVVVDESNRYIGSYDAGFFAETLAFAAVDERDDALAQRISGTVFGASLKNPVERIRPGEGYAAALNEKASVEQAFQMFRELKVDFIVITNALGEVVGVLTYKDLVNYLLTALTLAV